ncbi:polyketide synthase [Rickettsiella endosymbiont of Dermanyssus gallinae]|uniref:beta-ketoacyl [acyl carrier protein] synthase domain-containing protein n=1 Tax=Rickettsiella endosymbiont of Dermanyssus gallinae TaxID=2856608 RepID=UPI001C5275B1|nr:polyketide synthase [Rickettsiella endosymbiont of Dermanyssus gallinae]
MHNKLPKDHKYRDEDIVIIGMSCRFPDAEDKEKFISNLIKEKASIKEIPDERFSAGLLYEKNIIKSKWIGLLADVDKFDNGFFNISDMDAEQMDPQQRILLEETWHCIEDSAINLATLQNYTTSVYMAGMAFDYLLRILNKDDIKVKAKTCINNYACALSNRISHHFNFTGESYSSDAACASSFVPVKQAFNALRQEQCCFSIVGAVNILSHPLRYIDFSKSHMLGANGICKTFDAAADGYVQGEGAGVLLLTTYKMAKKIKAHIYAVLNAIELSHNGKNNSITAPSKKAQVDLLRKALDSAELKPQDISYIETHGTGTPLGDPIEVHAIKEVFNFKQQLYIGSVKSNIGHLEGAAGIAGIIKVILMMQKDVIPASINYNAENPLLELTGSNIRVANRLIAWEADQGNSIKRQG